MTIDEALEALNAARTEIEVHRAGYKLLMVAILQRPNYNEEVPKPKEEHSGND